MKRQLWIDTRGEPVITTTPNGVRNAKRWGWVEAVAVPQDAAPTETEWEYARQNRYGSVCEPDDSREQAEYRASLGGGYDTVVRRPLVWWEPLPVGGDDE